MSPSAPNVLDLFAGCGGISLGFQREGCRIIGGVEQEPAAARTHALNFHPNDLERYSQPRDIRVTDPVELLGEWGRSRTEVDILVGGPPCQAYTRVGRAKLRSIAADQHAWLNDARASLYEHYLRFVAALEPRALLMENVPEILDHGGHNVAEEICENLEELGYTCSYTLLNAGAYGVPQTRERFFLLAWRRSFCERTPGFPRPRHDLSDLPDGYKTTRSPATRLRQALLFGHRSRFDVGDFHAAPGFPAPVTVREAIGDLPSITHHLEGDERIRLAANLEQDPAPSSYANTCRDWPGFGAHAQVLNHVTRKLPRDYPIFREMRPGGEYPHALDVALRLYEQELHRRGISDGSPQAEDLRRAMVPPYPRDKFPNKWRKLEWDKPSRTLLAHLGHDCYTHIHPDSEQARTITVREAARLQSFPDGFRFPESMNQSFRMIGNAVPPLLASALADHLLTTLGIGQRERPAVAS